MSDSVSGETSTYAYDTMNRLHTVTITGGGNPRTYTYGYDNAGNRTSSSVTGTSPSSQTLTYNAANQITSTGYSYDGAGNLTAWPGFTATYNGHEQQISTFTTATSVTTSYTYAGSNQNELLSETPSGTANKPYKYYYGRTDSNGLPEIESVVEGSSAGYVLHDNRGLPVMLQTASAVTCLYLYDGLANPIAMSNSAQATSYTLRYDPYGAATRTDGGTNNSGWTENPYLFQGGVQDRITGNMKFGQRWYNTTSGAWTQQDTTNTPLDPKNANRYAYAADDPINDRDPLGRGAGEYVGACAKGALQGVVVGGITDASGVGVGVNAAVGCGVGLLSDLLQ